MSEVTVTQGASGKVWRMEYKGSVDYVEDAAPTEPQKKLFREQVDRALRQKQYDAQARERLKAKEAAAQEFGESRYGRGFAQRGRDGMPIDGEMP
jgi:hypothetical protein